MLRTYVRYVAVSVQHQVTKMYFRLCKSIFRRGFCL